MNARPDDRRIDDPVCLVREDLRAFAGYRSARREQSGAAIPADPIWLNANESPWPNPADAGGSLHRYPAPQPERLRESLAALYGVAPEQVLIGRGSDEAIDLLVRALCRAERDAIAIAPPVFGMYAVCAGLQGARLIEVPLLDQADGWRTDCGALAEAAIDGGAKLVFLCSPGNPTGEVIARDAVRALARALSGRALVVVDEAYLEFAGAPSCAGLIGECANVAVLRTLSKLHALAGARIGCLLADAGLIEVLRRCQAPYPVPAPCAEIALRALAPHALVEADRRAMVLRAERQRTYETLAGTRAVKRVYPSGGNFLLARFHDAEAAYRALLAAGVVVRDMRAAPGLDDALRLGIGAPRENAALLAAIAALAAPPQKDLARTDAVAEPQA